MLRVVYFCLFCAIATFAGCSKHPGNWTQATIEQKLGSKYGFTEFTLSPAGEGKYTGKAKSKEGETLKVTVTQDEKAKSLKYDFKGDRGWVEDGKYDLE